MQNENALCLRAPIQGPTVVLTHTHLLAHRNIYKTHTHTCMYIYKELTYTHAPQVYTHTYTLKTIYSYPLPTPLRLPPTGVCIYVGFLPSHTQFLRPTKIPTPPRWFLRWIVTCVSPLSPTYTPFSPHPFLYSNDLLHG